VRHVDDDGGQRLAVRVRHRRRSRREHHRLQHRQFALAGRRQLHLDVCVLLLVSLVLLVGVGEDFFLFVFDFPRGFFR